MYERILVALKWDPSDEAVVEHAGSLALLAGGHVTLAHVVHSHSRDQTTYLEEQALAYLAQHTGRLAARGVEATASVVAGEPASGITALARKLKADLIVMATHGHGEMRHVLVGSVTEDVIRQGDTPVLLVRPTTCAVSAGRSSTC
jgi:nucleotide-binding universal stress UspA family protein